MNDNNGLAHEIKVIVEKKLNSPLTAPYTVKLKGDASYRSYYRLFLEDGRSYILMKWNPEVGRSSEEVSKGLPIDEFPFTNIRNYLNSISIPVPEILFSDVDKGFILLEDLGDTTLENYFKHSSDLRLYERAIKLLAFLKYKSKNNPNNRCVAFLRKFDYELYLWEFEHFIEYGIEVRHNIRIPKNDRDLIKQYFSDISKRLDSASNIFTHRDYQSRNIMLKDDKLYLIDFQDALMGTIVYDIVALLRDSYVRFDNKIINDFIELYYTELKNYGFDLNYEEFVKCFYLQTIQRKLKDGGRFIFIDKVKKNPSFLPYVSISFEYAFNALSKFNEFRELSRILSIYVPEVR